MTSEKPCENGEMASTSGVRLTKHHALGNDFLVWLTDALPLDAPDRARRWCDRRTGIGADGLIVGLPADADPQAELVFRLFNSDGSPAAVSGNGLRCLAQAEAMRRGVVGLDLPVATPAGLRQCVVESGSEPHCVEVTVEMGQYHPGPQPLVDDLVAAAGPSVASVSRWQTVDVGNPHVVCQVPDPSAIDLAVAGPAIERFFPDGANVHFVRVVDEQALQLRVWERGAGITEACGTGATASAAVFHQWGLVGSTVRVEMPGGDAVVTVDESLTLRGPACFVAELTVANA